MPIFVALFVLIALIYGMVRAYDDIAARFGTVAAVGVAVIVAAAFNAAVAWLWRRHREIAPNIHDGDWTHELKAPWGGVRLAAGKGLCSIQLGGAKGDYI